MNELFVKRVFISANAKLNLFFDAFQSLCRIFFETHSAGALKKQKQIKGRGETFKESQKFGNYFSTFLRTLSVAVAAKV